MDATITLGRDGMGELATEDDFDAWCDYVCKRIDEVTGMSVVVDVRAKRDVQTDDIDCDDRETIYRAIQSLWNEFCADGVWQVVS